MGRRGRDLARVAYPFSRYHKGMRLSEVLPIHRETIRQLVLETGMSNPRVFGSVVRGEDEDGSDLDILVDPAPKTSLMDVA